MKRRAGGACLYRPAVSTLSAALSKRTRKPPGRLANYLQYLALRVVGMTLQSWPVEVGLWLAGVLGDGLFLIDVRHRKRAMSNIRRSFPEKSEPWIRDVARRSFQNEV